jgi:hypothetical protein
MNDRFLDLLITDFSQRVRERAATPVLHKAFNIAVPKLTVSESHLKSPTQARRLEREARRLEHTQEKMERSEHAAIERTIRKEIRDKLKRELLAKRHIARKTLSDELRDGRRRLREIHQRIEHELANVASAIERAYEKAVGTYSTELAKSNYPEVPPPFFAPSAEGDGIPSIPGIYFLWDGETIVYVGQSVNLNQRVRLGHWRLRPEYKISILPIDKFFLTWTECYYIGLVKPEKNFGRSASHYNHAANKPPNDNSAPEAAE